jgi:hypothetical protein
MQICAWFQDGKDVVRYYERSDYPATSRTDINVEGVPQIVKSLSLIIRNTAEELNVNKQTVRLILTKDLNMN